MKSEHSVRQIILEIFNDLIHPGAEQLSNDGAVLPLANLNSLAISADSFVSDVDFKPLWGSLFQAGQRAIRQNLSDLAAMGALPLGFTWSLEISDHWLQQPESVSEFLKGAASICATHNLKLLGGDLGTRNEGLGCHITILGQLTSKPLTRSAAQAGDALWVSGQLGESHLGLRLLQEAEQQSLFNDPRTYQQWEEGLCKEELKRLNKHLNGHDEIALGHRLVGIASSCIDISDGLSTDLQRICDASKVGAHLDGGVIAGSLNIENSQERGAVLHGGEDFVLLFTVPPHHSSELQTLISQGFELTQIGTVTSEQGVIRLHHNGQDARVTPRGWDAFSDVTTNY